MFWSLFYIFSIFDINCLSIYKALSLVIFHWSLKMLCVFVLFVCWKMLMYKLNWKACYLILCCHLSLNYRACCISFQCKVLHRSAPPFNTSSVIPAKPEIYPEQLSGRHFLVCQLLSSARNGAHQIIPLYYHLFAFHIFFNFRRNLCG